MEMIQSIIKIGNGKVLGATKIGKKGVPTRQQDGSTQDLNLTEVKFVPTLYVSLLSICKALKIGLMLEIKVCRYF
jgi:hypothetical protein